MTRHPARIALAVGDPNGIGPEISLKSVAAYQDCDDVHITLFGPQSVLEKTAHRLGLSQLLADTAVVPTKDLEASEFQPGRVDGAAGAAMIDAAHRAIDATDHGDFDAVVAAPHHETAVHLAGIAFSGYPSLVARVCGVHPDDVFMMLVGGGLHIVHVTLHESVQQALDRLTPELVIRATLAGQRAMGLLGIAQPRIGVFGINPHAGESGLFGDADEHITKPAVAQLRTQGLAAEGPFGADVLLANRQHDLYVAMLHDQGHIPIKLISPQQASAISIGARVILSSVGHGCAMDIAGRGMANPAAMIATIARLAHIPHPDTP